MALCAEFIYYTPPFREQKNFTKTKGIVSQGRYGVYIPHRLVRMGICSKLLLRGFQKMAKLWQKAFVKIDKTKIAISGQMLRYFREKVNLIYPLDRSGGWRYNKGAR
jgi:hypothetical protein